MRKIVAVTIYLWLPVVYGQTAFFEGRIIYQLKYTNPTTGEDITSDLAPYLGKELRYYIDANNYKSYDKDGLLTQLYNAKTNKYYFVNPSTRDVMELSGDESASILKKVESMEGTEVIAGLKCRKIKITTDLDTTTYWFAPQIKVPFTNFKNHTYGHWGTYLEATEGALPLKYISKTSLYIMTSTAEQIDEIRFKEDDFDISSMLGE